MRYNLLVHRDEGENQSEEGLSATNSPFGRPDTPPRPSGKQAAVRGSIGPLPAEEAHGTRSLRAWVVVVVLSALVGAGAAVGAGLGIVAAIHAADTTTVRFSPSRSVFEHMGDVKNVLAGVLPSVVTIQALGPSCEHGATIGPVSVVAGTGMILTRDGEILTNNHVIADASEIKVTLYGGKGPYPATLVGTDPAYDVALLRLHVPRPLPAVSLARSSGAEVGEDVLAIGNALALSKSTPSVTEGIISAKGRSIRAGGDDCAGTESLQGLLQTQAAINSGNSGGPLVDAAGKVIGMNTAAATTEANNAPTQNIGFAIPIARIESLLPGLRAGGSVGRPRAFLGVEVEPVTPASGLAPGHGAVVVDLFPASPAAAAGMRTGDVIVAFAGRPITSAVALTLAVSTARPGERVTVEAYRGERLLRFSVLLGTRPAPEPGSS
jgi:S1-C subfamily serine protease